MYEAKRQCIHCKCELELRYFEGGRKCCRQCRYQIRKEYLKEWNLAHPDQRKQWRETHPENLARSYEKQKAKRKELSRQKKRLGYSPSITTTNPTQRLFTKHLQSAPKDAQLIGKGYKNEFGFTRLQWFIIMYLIEHPCVDCGNSDIRVLEFDHIDPKTKSFGVCNGSARYKTWKELHNEIEKCVVRCANCHRIKTSIQANQYRNRFILEAYPKT